ncbi:hypothetical protein [Nostoc sp. CCY 9925]|uniref:hypothetical protein n=1 Tax=Nostoc sp. CCY 9925 TaxID=3103865 RepID=UPI0039C6E905
MARDKVFPEVKQRIEKAQREGAKELNLSGMGLTEVPEAIAKNYTQLLGRLSWQ